MEKQPPTPQPSAIGGSLSQPGASSARPSVVTGDGRAATPGEQAEKPKEEKKKGFFGRIFGVFK